MADDESASVPLGKGEQTRLDILHAAIARFGRDGFRGTSVAAIARDAGVSRTAAYAYFDTKKALFIAALDADAAPQLPAGIASGFRASACPRRAVSSWWTATPVSTSTGNSGSSSSTR